MLHNSFITPDLRLRSKTKVKGYARSLLPWAIVIDCCIMGSQRLYNMVVLSDFCFSQVNNGYILVVIHVSTSSQTIKVSIDDAPSEVGYCSSELKFYVLLLPVSLLYQYRFLFFRCWQTFLPKLQTKGFCWESLTTCASRTLCCVCVAGTTNTTTLIGLCFMADSE